MFQEKFSSNKPSYGHDSGKQFNANPNRFEGSVEAVKDQLFDSYMLGKITTSFFDDLEEYIEDYDAIDKMRNTLADYGDDEIYAALSWPAELRKTRFTKFNEALLSGKDAGTIMREHIEYCSKMGYGIGYHTSPVDIKPDTGGNWGIKPTEADHRDDDLTRAYYSRRYRHLFKQKNPKFVYVVRTEPATHKTDGNWSRASGLSIVTAVPYEDVIKHVEQTTKEFINKKQTAS